jgi:hypothetical protein
MDSQGIIAQTGARDAQETGFGERAFGAGFPPRGVMLMRKDGSDGAAAPGSGTGAASLWMLWGFFALSIIVYAGIGLLAAGGSTGAPAVSVIASVFAVAAAVETAVLFGLRGAMARRLELAAYAIILWALAESVGVLGLVLAFLGARAGICGAFLAWSLVLLLALRPTGSFVEDHARRHRGRTT